MDKNASLFLSTACSIADAQHDLFINHLEPFVANLKSAGMSVREMVDLQTLLEQDGFVKIRSADPHELAVFEITSTGLEWFFTRRYGIAGYHKILGDIARIKQERVLSGVKVTGDSIAEELKLPLMLVHHVLVSR